MSRCSVKLNPAAKDIMASLTLSLNNTSGIKTWTTATFAKGHILVCTLRGHQRLCEASFKNKFHLSCIHIEHFQCLLEKCFVRRKICSHRIPGMSLGISYAINTPLTEKSNHRYLKRQQMGFIELLLPASKLTLRR